ncbi:orc1/cdc6 family replication initiation protein, partial [mine drainage metagenome]
MSSTPDTPTGMPLDGREANRGATEGISPPAEPRSPPPAAGGTVPGPAAPPSGAASDFVDAYLASKSELFRGSREVLRESFVPARLPHREEQTRLVAEILAPALRGDLPSNLLIYGKIGTGKTAVVAQVRQELQRRGELSAQITFVTVNCGTIDTPYSLLQTIGNCFAPTEGERIPTGWALDRVELAMRRLMDARGGTV